MLRSAELGMYGSDFLHSAEDVLLDGSYFNSAALKFLIPWNFKKKSFFVIQLHSMGIQIQNIPDWNSQHGLFESVLSFNIFFLYMSLVKYMD